MRFEKSDRESATVRLQCHEPMPILKYHARVWAGARERTRQSVNLVTQCVESSCFSIKVERSLRADARLAPLFLIPAVDRESSSQGETLSQRYHENKLVTTKQVQLTEQEGHPCAHFSDSLSNSSLDKSCRTDRTHTAPPESNKSGSSARQ